MQGVIKHMIITKERHTIIFFDIRNFSEHRSRLADKGRASLLTEFVKDVLNGAVDLLNARKEQFEMDPKPILNHTGDGFMLIVRGRKNPLLGLLWLSEFRRFVSSRIKNYERSIAVCSQAPLRRSSILELADIVAWPCRLSSRTLKASIKEWASSEAR